VAGQRRPGAWLVPTVAHANEGWTPQDLFRNFAYALLEGTIGSENPASRSLFWPSVPHARAKGLIKCVEAFAEWCSTQNDTKAPISPDIVPLIPGTAEQTTHLLIWARLRQLSMLQHIKHAPKTAKRSLVDLGRTGWNK
jgi:hypothetical protein